MFVHVFSGWHHTNPDQHLGHKLDFSFIFMTHQVMSVSPQPSTKVSSCQPDTQDFSWSSLCTFICHCSTFTLPSIPTQPGLLFLLLETSLAFSMLSSMHIMIKNNTFPWYSCCVLVISVSQHLCEWNHLLDFFLPTLILLSFISRNLVEQRALKEQAQSGFQPHST